MASTWIDYGIVSVIILGGLFILYKALKEPMDLMFGAIGKGIGKIRDMFSGGDDGEGYEVISYG